MPKELIETEKGAALGYKINLPNANFLLVEADLGYIACGYFNSDTIEQLDDVAVLITGANTFKELLREQPSYVSPKARDLGINLKMTGKQCLNKLIKSEEEDLDEMIKEGEEGEIDEIQI